MTNSGRSSRRSPPPRGLTAVAQVLWNRAIVGLCWLMSLRRQVRDGIDIAVFHRHLRQTVVKDSARLGPNVAIIATWPRYPLRNSVKRLLEALTAQGWSVVLVINESPDTDRVIDDWSASADVVIRRANIGRDFGAYQCGYQYVSNRPEFEQSDRLAFFNDSVFYPPNVDSIVAELLKKDTAIAGFFVNHQFHTHVQSFALVITSPAATSSQLREFWSGYYPSNIRRYAIHNGEVELTRRILEVWPEVEAVVTHGRLLEADPDVWSNLTIAEQQTLWTIVHGGVRYDLQLRRKRNRAVEIDLIAREAFASHNASHSLGMVATRLLGAPLKLDLIKWGLCTPTDVAETLLSVGVDEQELSEVMAMLTAAGTRASLGFLTARMRVTGFGD